MTRRNPVSWVLGIALAIACAATPARGQSNEIDLAAMKPNAPPDNFQFGRTGNGPPGQWTVVNEDTASHGIAIAQMSRDRTDYRFPLAIYQPASLKNGAVAVHFMPVSGRVDQAGGIAVRLTTPDDYYLVRANALEDNVRFYRVVKAGASSWPVPTSKWRRAFGTR